jgi:hypothetical protein
MSSGLPVVAEAGGEFLEVDAAIFVRVQPAKNCSYALGVSALKWGEGCKLVRVKATIFTGDFGKLFFSSFLQGCSPSVPGSLPLLVGEFSITIGIEFGDMCFTTLCTGGPAGFLGSLALFLINSSIFVEIKLLEHFRQFTVPERPVAVCVGKAEAKGKAGKG